MSASRPTECLIEVIIIIIIIKISRDFSCKLQSTRIYDLYLILRFSYLTKLEKIYISRKRNHYFLISLHMVPKIKKIKKYETDEGLASLIRMVLSLQNLCLHLQTKMSVQHLFWVPAV